MILDKTGSSAGENFPAIADLMPVGRFGTAIWR
jgi:hypothetical protein